MTRIPFHPLLFAMLPVLSMFAASPGQRHDHELNDALRIVVGGAGVLLLLAAAIYRDVRKAALAASALLLALCVQIDDGSIGSFGNKRFVMPLMYWGSSRGGSGCIAGGRRWNG